MEKVTFFVQTKMYLLSDNNCCKMYHILLIPCVFDEVFLSAHIPRTADIVASVEVL